MNIVTVLLVLWQVYIIIIFGITIVCLIKIFLHLALTI
uniref:E10 protein n=1 Tax=Human papillomavirus type 214 TaxID=2060138 RepID=A0A2H4V8E2_9PAPI|nr:E10 protein [Human papillomavirus type 214]CAD1814239.1 E10 protein [Human papillomavirus type 214]